MTHYTKEDVNTPEFKKEFDEFVQKGKPNELSRCYMSVNTRDPKKVQKALMHFMLDNQVDLTKIENKVARLAARSENRKSNKWLFDCDFSQSSTHLNDFLSDMVKLSKDADIVDFVKKSKSGYHVVAKHGFDIRVLLEKYPDVSLHRDDFVYMYSKSK